MKKLLLVLLSVSITIAAAGQSRSNTGSGSSSSTSRQTTTGTAPARSSSSSSSSSVKSDDSRQTPSAGTVQGRSSGAGRSSSEPAKPGDGTRPGAQQGSQGGGHQSGSQGGDGQNINQSGPSTPSTGTARTNHSQTATAPKPAEERINDARGAYNDARMDYKGTKKQVKVDKKQEPAFKYPPQEPRPSTQMHPPVPPRPVYSSADRYARTRASEIVLYTDFASKLEARAYIEDLLLDRYYTLQTYTSDSYIETEMTLVPTGFNTKTVFSMRFHITRSLCGRVRIYITGRWRESSLAESIFRLVFQPDDSYSTYYAWSVLEDVAACIPHYRMEFHK